MAMMPTFTAVTMPTCQPSWPSANGSTRSDPPHQTVCPELRTNPAASMTGEIPIRSKNFRQDGVNDTGNSGSPPSGLAATTTSRPHDASSLAAVAAAGPGTNLILAAIGAVLLGLIAGAVTARPEGAFEVFLTGLNYFIVINIFLALFNLLPIPPFDGSHVVEGLLPRRAAAAYAATRPYAFFLMIGLLVVLPTIAPELDLVRQFLLPPVDWAMDQYLAVVKAVAGA